MLSKTGLYKHRIVPGHMGGTYDPDNVILLTVLEHAEAHRVLWEQHHLKADWIAWKMLGGQITKKELSQELELIRRERISKGLTGRTVSKRTREKISLSNTGKKLTSEHRKKLSNAKLGKSPWNKGKKWSKKTKKLMSLAKLGKPWSAKRRAAYERTKTDE